VTHNWLITFSEEHFQGIWYKIMKGAEAAFFGKIPTSLTIDFKGFRSFLGNVSGRSG